MKTVRFYLPSERRDDGMQPEELLPAEPARALAAPRKPRTADVHVDFQQLLQQQQVQELKAGGSAGTSAASGSGGTAVRQFLSMPSRRERGVEAPGPGQHGAAWHVSRLEAKLDLIVQSFAPAPEAPVGR